MARGAWGGRSLCRSAWDEVRRDNIGAGLGPWSS